MNSKDFYHKGEGEKSGRVRPGFVCLTCSQIWSKDADRSLRGRGSDNACPFCGANTVRKWRAR